MGADESTVKMFADLFFDVRDRLEARDWIMKVILGPAELRSKFNKDETLTIAQRGFLYRLFGFYGGPLVLDALIAGIGGREMPVSAAEVAEWIDNSLQEIVRTRAAMAARVFDVNRNNVITLLKLALPRKGKKVPLNAADQEEFSRQVEERLAASKATMGAVWSVLEAMYKES